MEIIGHRGASFDAPENTLASVRLAWEQHADAVEIDVRLTRDGQIVAFHDETTGRIGGRDVPVEQHTLDELRRLDAGSWKGPRFAGERIPTLEEVLETVPAGKRLLIEIKSGPLIQTDLARVLQSAPTPPEQVALIGFDLDVLQFVQVDLLEWTGYWVVALQREESTGRWLPRPEELARKATDAGVQGIDLGPAPEIDAEYVAPLRRAGLELYVWTVNDLAAARRFVRLGFDGIATDRPGWLREQLDDGFYPLSPRHGQ